MDWIDYVWLVALVLVGCFSFVLVVGAPYVPTLPVQKAAALREATSGGAKPVLYELGSGDGTVMLAAAKMGLKTVGYEINPVIWLVSWIRLRRYRSLASVRLGNFWSKDISEADVVFVFLHPRFMAKLDNKITQETRKKIKLISFAFEIPGKKPVGTPDGLFIYEYEPAKQ